MNAMVPLLALRTHEVVRTWRVWVLPGVLVFLAATGPVITRFTKEILAGALGGGEIGAIPIPDPTAADAARTLDHRSLAARGLRRCRHGSGGDQPVKCVPRVASLLLVKPASRAAYVVSHAAVLMLFVAVAALLGAIVSWAVTGLVFDGAAGGVELVALLGATGVWVVLATVLIAISLLASAAFDALWQPPQASVSAHSSCSPWRAWRLALSSSHPLASLGASAITNRHTTG